MIHKAGFQSWNNILILLISIKSLADPKSELSSFISLDWNEGGAHHQKLK